MLNIQSKMVSKDPDLIYFDVCISNLSNTITNPPVLTYNEVRNSAFVQTPENYEFSIIRFTLDTGHTLPVFIPEINLNQTNPIDVNLTIYSYQFSYNDGVKQISYSEQYFIEWSPQDLSAQVPTTYTGTGTIDNSAGYYNCYQYTYFIDLINNSIATNWAAFYARIGSPTDIPITPPVFFWDSTNNVASIAFPLVVESGGNSLAWEEGNQLNFYMNAPLYQLFGSFPSYKLGYNTAAGLVGRNFQLIVSPNQYQTLNLGSTNTSTMVLIQEWSTTCLWSPIASLVFITGTLPIIANQLSKPLIYNEGSSLNNFGNNSNFAQVITDIVSTSGNYSPNLVYNPSGEYRMISMTGNQPLTSIDISVLWKDKFGNLNPFYLGSGCNCTLKLMFRRKGAI